MGIVDFLFKAATVVGDITSAPEKVDKIKNIFIEDSVTPEDFLEFCNERLYDISNDSRDIKLAKTIDFSGAYILHNNTTGFYYIGVSKKVYRKVERILNGYEKELIIQQIKRNHKFTIQLIRLENTDCDTLDELYEGLKNKYTENNQYIFI